MRIKEVANKFYVGDVDINTSTFKLPDDSVYLNTKKSKLYSIKPGTIEDITGSTSIGGGSGVSYQDSGEPAKDINPDNTGVFYLDTDNFTVYICTDNTEDDNVWQVLNINEFTKYMCETPDIEFVDDNTTECNERDYVEVNIKNYDEEATYISDSELVAKLRYKSDNVYKVYFGSVDEDTDITFKLRAFKLGFLNSDWSNGLDIKVKDRGEEEDDAIINDAFDDNKDSSSDADVTNDKVTFTKDGGEYLEVITEQGDDEENWSSYQTIARIALDKMTIIDDDTDTDTLAVRDKHIEDVSKCYIINDDYPNGVEIDIGDVDEIDGTSDTLDIFDDDSCLALYCFEDDLTDKSGNYDMTKLKDDDDDFTYDSGHLDKCVIKPNTRLCWNSMVDKLADNNKEFSVSMWCYFDSNDKPDHYWRIMDFYNHRTSYHYTEKDFSDFKVTHGVSFGDVSDYLDYDSWHHIVFVYDNWVANDANLTVYINNNKIDTKSVDSADDEDKDSCIGSVYNSDDDYKVSRLDEIRVFDKQLSDDDIDTLYNESAKKYKADISSNDLDSAPTSAFFTEENVTIKTALTEDDPTDDDFNEEDVDSWKIDDDNEYKENTYKKVSDYSGTEFQRKVTGDKDANITYLKSNMWKDQ